jgi:hypothetical protein
MLPDRSIQHSLALRALIVAGLVAFGFFLVTERGLLGFALQSDRSYISYVILLIYVVASGHWLLLSFRMSGERNRLERVEHSLTNGGKPGLVITAAGVRWGSEEWNAGDLVQYLRGVLIKRDSAAPVGEQGTLAATLGDVIANRHSAGHFFSDTLLKLGLLGTMVGFILMLLPVSGMREFEPALAQQLLRDMSGGMAVALYTTLAGLVTSTLLKLQYQILDTSAQDFLNRVAFMTDVHLATPLVGPESGD